MTPADIAEGRRLLAGGDWFAWIDWTMDHAVELLCAAEREEKVARERDAALERAQRAEAKLSVIESVVKELP